MNDDKLRTITFRDPKTVGAWGWVLVDDRSGNVLDGQVGRSPTKADADADAADAIERQRRFERQPFRADYA
jgi:hypothetical protein